MSVRGLYDSEIGDRLARATLAPFRKLDDVAIDDVAIDDEEAPRTSGRMYLRKKCACGVTLTYPARIRENKYVCQSCADKIPRMRGGHAATNKCSNCKTITPRRALFMRGGKKYCGECVKKISA